MMEFVLFNESGREVDWIDPVREFNETEEHWTIYNGYHTYTIPRAEGFRYVIREKAALHDRGKPVELETTQATPAVTGREE